jgi:uncharacterized membrane protein YcjF (UPF0283 family)
MTDHRPHETVKEADESPLTPLRITLKALLDFVLITVIAGVLIFCLALQEVRQAWNRQTWIFAGLLGIMLLQFILRGIKYIRLFRDTMR